jgi:Tol biopolymer transport system component
MSAGPSISGDGRWVAFISEAWNLVPGDTNSELDVFVFDRATGALSRVSVASDGRQALDESTDPAISANGRAVAFTSSAAPTTADRNQDPDVYLHFVDVRNSQDPKQ